MDIIVNIGLARAGTSNIAMGTVLREIDNHGFQLLDHAVLQSDSEPTVVARLRTPPAQALAPTISRLYFLSSLLGQDCIAYYDLTLGRGALTGPRAAKWGPFNPDFFFLLDGTRLSQHLSASQAA